MTAQEERFENFVNEEQAYHDIIAEFEEWKRCKRVEEEAITVYRDVNGDMGRYLHFMATRDQAEAEFQCQRKKDTKQLLRRLWAMEQRWMKAPAMEAAGTVKEASVVVEEAAASAEAATRGDFKGKATKYLMADKEFVPTAAAAAASQQARRQESPASNQPGPSTEPGPPSQQVQESTRMTFEEERAREIALMARGDPGSLRIVPVKGRFYEVQIPAAGEVVNVPGGGGDQDVGSVKRSSTNSSSRRPSSEEASSTPPSSRPSPSNLSHHAALKRLFYGTPNVTVSDSRGSEDMSPERSDLDLNAILTACLERVIDEEGEGRYAAQ